MSAGRLKVPFFIVLLLQTVTAHCIKKHKVVLRLINMNNALSCLKSAVFSVVSAMHHLIYNSLFSGCTYDSSAINSTFHKAHV